MAVSFWARQPLLQTLQELHRRSGATWWIKSVQNSSPVRILLHESPPILWKRVLRNFVHKGQRNRQIWPDLIYDSSLKSENWHSAPFAHITWFHLAQTTTCPSIENQNSAADTSLKFSNIINDWIFSQYQKTKRQIIQPFAKWAAPLNTTHSPSVGPGYASKVIYFKVRNIFNLHWYQNEQPFILLSIENLNRIESCNWSCVWQYI